MAECKACGEWFGTAVPQDLCPTCERALKQLNGYAVPVVRCRHCRSHHWEQEPCHGKTVHYCKKLDAEVTADFFCAAGKRLETNGRIET